MKIFSKTLIFVILTLLVANIAYADLSTNLIHAWNLDESGADATGADEVGAWTLTKSGGTWVTGVLNNAYSQSQNGLQNTAVAWTEPNIWTISGWVKSSDAGYAFAVFWEDVNNNIGIKFNNDGKVRITHEVGGAPTHIVSTGRAYNDNAWHLWITEINHATQKVNMWVDNVQEITDGALVHGAIATPIDEFVPCSSSDLYGITPGVNDEINIWDRVLTSGERTELFSIDNVTPEIIFVNPESDNTSLFTENFSLNINVTDTFNFFAEVNISLENSTRYFSKYYNTSKQSAFNINNTINLTSYEVDGNYLLHILVGDTAGNNHSEVIKFYFNDTSTNLMESYETLVNNNAETTYYLNVNPLIPQFYDTASGITAYLEINHTNYTATINSLTSYEAKFSKTLTTIVDATPTNLSHKWHVVSEGVSGTNISLSSDLVNQTFLIITLGVCDATNIFPVLNISYFDEINDEAITTTNAYDLTITNGTSFFNQLGSFEGNSKDAFCTSLDGSYWPYVWDMWGTFTLSKDGYVTRVFTIPETTPTIITNNPANNISFQMITLGNSTTVKYNWLTTSNELIDGTMQVYRCDQNGIKTLVEQKLISNGVAHADIVLTTQPYSYSVLIDETTYTDDAWSTCHVEIETELTFYVDLSTTPLSPQAELGSLDCTLTQPTSTQATLTWGINPEDSTSIQACIVGINYTRLGGRALFTICTNTTTLTNTIVLPQLTQYVFGRLTQGNNQVYCDDSLRPALMPIDTDGLFGNTMLFPLILMLLGVAVMLAETGMVMSLGVSIVLGGAVLAGLTGFGWGTAALACIFLLVCGFIARYTRKRD